MMVDIDEFEPSTFRTYCRKSSSTAVTVWLSRLT